MKVWDQNVLLVISDAVLKRELFSELLRQRPAGRDDTWGHYQVHASPSLAEALGSGSATGERPVAVVLDQSALARDASLHEQWQQIRELAEAAPVILIVEAGCLHSLNGLAAPIASGRIEVVGRDAATVPLVMALVARHSASQAAAPIEDFLGPDFGEALRHELNNPLTGILGNAELLLARRDQLPAGAVERLQTIADLAVRLRETVRRLSNAWEGHMARIHEEVNS